jgi:uncharacterized protein involved in outer membrane biogenesis
MRLLLKILAWTLLVIVVLTGGLYLYLRNADLNVYEEQIEGLLTKAIGHEVDFNGVFELRFGRITTVTAENISIRNPDWNNNQPIVNVERFFVSLRTWSVLIGPAIVEELEISGLDVRLERNEAGDANWESAKTSVKAEAKPPGEFNPNAVVVKELQITSARFNLSNPAREKPINALISSLTISPDADAVLAIDLDGVINDYALLADGKIGPLENLIKATDVSADLDLTLGLLQLSLDGAVADLRNLRGVSLLLNVNGPAIERLIETLSLPPFAEGAYDISASISPQDGDNHINLKGNIGSIELYAEGDINEFLKPEEISLEYRFAGPESAYIASLFGVDDATRAAFNVKGGFRRDGRRYGFIDTDIELGRGRIGIDGWLEGTGGIPNMDLGVSATGPNLAVFDPFIDLDGIPADPFDISGRIQKEGNFWRFDNVDVEIGEIDVEARGEIGGKGDPDNHIEFRATGPDMSTLAEITGLDGLPARPFDVSADLRSANNGIRVESATGIFGDNRIDASGILNLDARLAGTDLETRVQGTDLGNITVLTGIPNLPQGAFDVAGRLRIDGRRVRFTKFAATAGDLRAKADGFLLRGSKPLQFEFDVGVSGPDLAAALPYEPLDRLPGEAYELSGRVNAGGSNLALHDVNVSLGNLQVFVDGKVDTAKLLESDDVEFSASAPDARILRILSGLENLPDGAFALAGRLDSTDTIIRVSNGTLSLGDFRASIDGEVARSRPYFGNDIKIAASGPGLYELGRIFGYEDLSSLPFTLVTEFDGTETGFVTEEFSFGVGDSTLAGTMSAELSGDKPIIQAGLLSTLLDLRHAQQQLSEARKVEAEVASEASEAATGTRKVFSDEPLKLDWLDAADVDFDLKADKILMTSGEVSDFQLVLELRDGNLTIDPISFTQQRGIMSASLQLLPRDDRYDLTMSVDIDDVRPPFLAAEGQDPMTIPPVDIEFSLHGQGNSVAEIMGSSDGYLFMFQEKGQVAVLGLDFMFTDLVSGIVRTINPLVRRSTYTELDCIIFNIDIGSGVATIKNVAVQTDRLTVVGSGNINLATEKLSLSVRTKPREGIGVSVGGVVNSFLRVAGTIGKPSIEIDPASSVTTTGAAVATGGLSLLATGLWNRLSAEADMCKSLPRSRREE